MKVLIADDSRLTRTLLKAFVAAKLPEAVFVEADSGSGAVAAAQQGGFGLITLDMNMPGGDGLSVLPAVRDANPNALIALVTANIQNAVQQRAAENGAVFIPKPVTEDKVRVLLEALS